MKTKTPARRWISFTILLALFISPSLLQGCDAFHPDDLSDESQSPISDQIEAPVSNQFAKLRHPQMLDKAKVTFDASLAKNGGEEVHLILAFNGYEADGITPRLLNRYGVTRRMMSRYGDDIRFKVQINKAFDGISVKVDENILGDFLNDLATDPDIAWAEPDFEATQLWQMPEKKGHHHSDQLIPWGIARIGGGIDKPKDDKKIHVYIMDSGISKEDVNLGEQKDFTMLFQNRSNEFWDADLQQDTPVYDPKEKGNPADENGHGTHIAATIGAENNKDGMLGAAPKVKIHSLKVLTEEGRTDITTVTAAVDYVTQQKLTHPDRAIIVNMSFGMDIGTTAYNSLDEAVAKSIEAGVVYVVSAGNDGKDASTYSPAHVEGVITVGAYNENDTFSSFSNYGPAVDILAPGENILSLSHIAHEVRHKEFILNSGTSFAAPHVSAAVALYMGKNPKATPAEVKDAIMASARSEIRGVPGSTTNKTVHAGDFTRDKKKDKKFKLSKAKFDKKKNSVEISGEGPRHELVVLFDENDLEIARIMTGLDAKWKILLEQPSTVPCSIRATLNKETQTKKTEHRPATCNG